MLLLFLKSSHILVYLLGITLLLARVYWNIFWSVAQYKTFTILSRFRSHHCQILVPPISIIYPIVEKIALEFWSFLFCWWWRKEIRFRSSRHWWCISTDSLGCGQPRSQGFSVRTRRDTRKPWSGPVNFAF